MDSVAAVALLKRVSIFELAGTDGCLCMHCSVQGVDIDVACRKSSDPMEKLNPGFYGLKIRISSPSLDASREALQAVADEVVAQLKDEGYEMMVRLCDTRYDEKRLCIWCGEPREDAMAYTCRREKCVESRRASWFDAADFESPKDSAQP